jgi:hypothetical protein
MARGGSCGRHATAGEAGAAIAARAPGSWERRAPLSLPPPTWPMPSMATRAHWWISMAPKGRAERTVRALQHELAKLWRAEESSMRAAPPSRTRGWGRS